MRKRLAIVAALTALPVLWGVAHAQQSRPKRLLVIGATAAFRHPSIPNWEIYLHQIASDFDGQVVMTYMADEPNYPFSKVPQRSGGGGGGAGRGGFPGVVPTATDAQQAAIVAASIPLAPLNTAATNARTAVTTASLTGSAADVSAKVDALIEAEKTLALARKDAILRLMASPNRLNQEQMQALSGVAPAGAGRGGAPAGMGGGADPKVMADLFKKYTSPEALKNYDGIFFVSTTGNLPIPDEPAFLEWVKQGHGIIGIHAAMDRGDTSDAHMDMLAAGARFNGHPGNANAPSKVVRVDPKFPATKDFPATLDVTDEFYSYHYQDKAGTWIPGVDYSKVHALLELDRGDGVAFPVAWAKMYGNGRVFYSSMGHRDDVFMATGSMDYDGLRDNSDAVIAAERKHIVAGIKWALGLIDGDVTPGNLKVDPALQVSRSAAAGGGRGAGGRGQ